VNEGSKEPKHYEKTVRGQRVGHMVALIVDRLKEFGLHPSVPIEQKPEDGSGPPRGRWPEGGA
jgi:hypothetical protein